MDSENDLDFEDNRRRESQQSSPSRRRNRKDSESSLHSGKQNGKFNKDPESRTAELKRDRDRISDEEHSRTSFYSEDYENASLSERSFSPPSPSPPTNRTSRTRRVSSSPLHRTGVRRGVSRRPGAQVYAPQQRCSGLRSQSQGKDAPQRDVDPVTRRLLSARLLKISELQNALAELRAHAEELQRENRLLQQLQLRQERALQRYSHAESEVSQLISRHSSETRALRERLRRSQEGERAAERRCREADAQLQRSRSQLHKLQQLADDQQLGERDELNRRLTLAQTRAQDSERRVNELEKNIELSNGSFQRQLAGERRKTHDALQEVQTLREETERLCAKLKEKERELDARNIYSNRITRAASKKESENPNKKKGLVKLSSKSVQTEDRTLSLDFPSPPPAVSEFPDQDQDQDQDQHQDQDQDQDPDQDQDQDQVDDYLSLKVEQQISGQKQRETKEWRTQETERETERLKEKEREKERERDRRKVETQRIDQDSNQDTGGSSIGSGRDREDQDVKRWSQLQREEEEKKSHDQDEEDDQWMRDQEVLADQEREEEERRRKLKLLEKMREIDLQTQDSDFFSDEPGSVRSPPRRPEQRNHDSSLFSSSQHGAGKRGGALRAQKPSQELDFAFGSYQPSFGKPTSRSSVANRNQSQPEAGDTGLNLSGLLKERKSNLMQQLFGSTAAAAASPPESPRRLEILSSASSSKPQPVSQSGRRRDGETPTRLNISGSSKSVYEVSESRPAVRAITSSYDDDIEEVTL